MTKPLKLYTLDEVKNDLIGQPGSPEREAYEFELEMELISRAIKMARQERNLTQSELGEMVGVKKAQISRLEKNPQNVTISTLQKVFKALNARVKLSIDL